MEITVLNAHVFCKHVEEKRVKDVRGFKTKNKDRVEELTVAIDSGIFKEGDKVLVLKQNIIGTDVRVNGESYIVFHRDAAIAKY